MTEHRSRKRTTVIIIALSSLVFLTAAIGVGAVANHLWSLTPGQTYKKDKESVESILPAMKTALETSGVSEDLHLKLKVRSGGCEWSCVNGISVTIGSSTSSPLAAADLSRIIVSILPLAGKNELYIQPATSDTPVDIVAAAKELGLTDSSTAWINSNSISIDSHQASKALAALQSNNTP